MERTLLALLLSWLVTMNALAGSGRIEDFKDSWFGVGPQDAAEKTDPFYANQPTSNRAPASAVGVPTTGKSFSDNIPTSLKGVQEFSVIANDLGFWPKTFFVTENIPVRLYVTGASKNTLCIMLDTFDVKKQVQSAKVEEITFTPRTPGRYRFYCPVNGMEGEMIVREMNIPDPDAEKKCQAAIQKAEAYEREESAPRAPASTAPQVTVVDPAGATPAPNQLTQVTGK